MRVLLGLAVILWNVAIDERHDLPHEIFYNPLERHYVEDTSTHRARACRIVAGR